MTTSALTCIKMTGRGVIESGGLENNINKLISIYRSRAKVMDSLLPQHLPNIQFSNSHGGYFFWLRWPERPGHTLLEQGLVEKLHSIMLCSL
jgi:DNA-binding transcriptional MocR family regulator